MFIGEPAKLVPMKKFLSHGASFILGLGLGLLISLAKCPPTGTPGATDAQPSKPEVKVEIKEAPKAEEPVKPEIKPEEAKKDESKKDESKPLTPGFDPVPKAEKPVETKAL